MNEYHKIQTVWLRDPATKFKTLLEGQWALPEFEYLQDCGWEGTEKVDGTNIRVMREGNVLRFGGKTDNANIPPFLLDRLEQIFTPWMMDEVFENNPICLYGEGYGNKIQSAGKQYIPDGVDFVLFDVKVGDWWLERDDVVNIAGELGIGAVPVIALGTLGEMIRLVRNGFASQWGNFAAEGIVARPRTQLFNRKGQRIITKIKYKDFVR